MLEVERINDEATSLSIGGRTFACEADTGDVTIPKDFLSGFRLSDIPGGVRIKPVEKIDGNTIDINHDYAVSQFSNGSASAFVEEMFRRKFWDGETGLSPYVAALRQAIIESEVAREEDFRDDGDYIFVQYVISIADDFEVQDAVHFVDAAIERVQTRAEQLVSRRKDGLLDIFDRGSFDADLTHVLNGKQPVALIMADVDHFKAVNDTFGHVLGDEVLRAVAQILSSKCGDRSRVPYRYGGEELGIILTGDDTAKGMELAESIRAAVEQLRFDAEPQLKLTISLGVAEVPDGGRNSPELVKRADAALYQAKQEGRNRVSFFRKMDG